LTAFPIVSFLSLSDSAIYYSLRGNGGISETSLNLKTKTGRRGESSGRLTAFGGQVGRESLEYAHRRAALIDGQTLTRFFKPW
jgi:hypothetical protein